MAEWTSKTIDAEIDAALDRARHLPDLPGAVSAQYYPQLDSIEILLTGGRRLLLPRLELQGLESATEEQLSQIEIHAGVDIAWPQLDIDHYLPSLLAGQYGSNRWMKALERRGVPDTPNNNGHAIAKLKASHALYPLMGPFSHVEGHELRAVREIYENGCLCELALIFSSGSFLVTAIAVDDTIGIVFSEKQQVGTDVTHNEPWNTFIGGKAGLCWLAMNQQGYLDSVLLSFRAVVSPEVAITVVASELKVRSIHSFSSLVSSTTNR